MIRKEKETQSKALTIMGDKEIPYGLLRKIIGDLRPRKLRRSVVRRHPEGQGVMTPLPL